METQVTPAGVELESMEYLPESRRHRARYDQDTTAASTAVVAALSTVRNCKPTDLNPLATSVDPDALDELATGELNEHISIVFHAWEHTITVDSDGGIEIAPQERLSPENGNEQVAQE